jgi:hypothetical protein
MAHSAHSDKGRLETTWGRGIIGDVLDMDVSSFRESSDRPRFRPCPSRGILSTVLPARGSGQGVPAGVPAGGFR